MTFDDYVKDENSEKNFSDLQNFLDEEVFFNIPNAANFESANLQEAGLDGRLEISTATVDQGKMTLFFTTNTNDKLVRPFGGIPFRDALSMTTRLDDADGLLLHSSVNSWIIIPKEAIGDMLPSTLRSRTYRG